MADPFIAALDQATRTVVARVRGELPRGPQGDLAAGSDAISHTFCCEANRALCGLDLQGAGPSGEGDQECVVCADLVGHGVACQGCFRGHRAA